MTLMFHHMTRVSCLFSDLVIKHFNAYKSYITNSSTHTHTKLSVVVVEVEVSLQLTVYA